MRTLAPDRQDKTVDPAVLAAQDEGVPFLRGEALAVLPFAPGEGLVGLFEQMQHRIAMQEALEVEFSPDLAPSHREENDPITLRDVDFAAGERVVAEPPGCQRKRL